MTFPPILKLQSLNNGLKQARELGKITIHLDLLDRATLTKPDIVEARIDRFDGLSQQSFGTV